MLCESLNVADHYTHLAQIFGVSDELHDYASFDTTEAAAAAAAAAKAELFAEIKHQKDMRRESIDRTMLGVIEIVAQMFQINTDELVESIVDEEPKTECVHRFFRQNGSEALIFSCSSNSNDAHRIGILHEKDTFQTEECVVVYRIDNIIEVNPKNVSNLVNISDIKPDDKCSLTLILARVFHEIWLPAFIQFGQAGNTDTVMVLNACQIFLENCDSITKNSITLNIDKEFYEANLSGLDKIKATSENRKLVELVEKISIDWMRIIETILIKGNLIRRSFTAIGPTDELEHWLQTHSMYSIAQELISSEIFRNHLKCLQLSRSKLVHKWKDVANQLETTNAQATENVQFLNSLERFQFPLYGKIDDIKMHVDPLFGALRTVYKTSTFYNTSNSMASFLSKCTNHLTQCCRNFILNGNSSNLFVQPSDQLLVKIAICLELLGAYRKTYEETVEQMKAAGEPEWKFSEKYVFGQANQLVDRLSKLQRIIQTDVKYSILENILMEDIQKFSEPINNAYNEIVEKTYDHLDFRQEQFEIDFTKWQKTIKRLENEMHAHVEADIHQFPISPLTALNHLKRFEGLNFDCMTVKDRYIDVVIAFVNNINSLKESFNLTKVSPEVPNLMCQYSGRISWVRSIEMKLNEVISLLKRNDIFNTENVLQVQTTIKYYNALSKDLTLYEFQQYKAWFDNVHYVFDLLNQPIIRRNPISNRLEVNFDIMILNTIEEGKKNIKLNLDIPQLGQALVKYEDDLRRKLQLLSHLIEWNNELRHSVHVIFVNICRPQLRKIDQAFKPGLSQIQWLSKDFDAYITNAEKILADFSCLLKRAMDRKIFHIEDIILSMSELKLVTLFDKPIDIKILLDGNEKHKQTIEEMLMVKSTMAEKATVELIKLFISKTDIQSVENKYDFIAFEKLFQQVFVYNEGDHIEPLFKDYDELQYGIEQLHSDCMDLFNYFAHQILDGMIKNTKVAYDKIREHFFLKEEPAVLAVAKIEPSSCCYLSPHLDSISETFLLLIHNITDIFVGIRSWGELAAIPESVKYNLAEIDLEEGFLNNVLGNKEIQRAISKFDSGLSLLQPSIDSLLKEIYKKYCYLFVDEVVLDSHIQAFVDADPYPSTIEDEFTRYQTILDELENAVKIAQIDCLAIELQEIYDKSIEHAKKRKQKLAELLAIVYKDRYDELNDFIETTECMLRRQLTDEEDFTAAIECLVNVYTNGDRMETILYKTTGTFGILEKFNEPIGKVEKHDVEQLPIRYATMFAQTKGVEVYIRNNFDEIMSKM